MTIVDVSAWQGSISESTFDAWGRAGVTRVVHKAGGFDDGAYKDSRHDSNVANCRAARLGVDHYLFNGPTAAQTAANDFAAWAAPRTGDKLWLDLESPNRWGAAFALQVATAVRAHTGILPGNYMSASVLGVDDWAPNAQAGQELWVAQYGSNDGTPQGAPSAAPWKGYTYWQYTSQGHLPGYGGPLDFSLTGAPGSSTVIGLPSSPTGYNASTWSTATIQAALNTVDHAGLVVDNDYGTATTGAVHAFEVKYGLGVDVGIAGPEVVGKLASLLKISEASATRIGLVVDGSEGHLTTAAEQRALQHHGISVGTAGDDGIRGHDTILAEQIHTGARRDGIDGPDTTRHLQTLLIHAGFSCGPAGVDGNRGPDTVMALQRALNAGKF